MNLSSISVKVVATSLLLASTTGLAFAKHHKHQPAPANYKAENYKAEVPPCPPPRMLMDGFYLGAQVGYDSYRLNRSGHGTIIEGGTIVDEIATSSKLSATGWVGGLFIGYGKYFSDLYYLGAEAFGGYSGAQGNESVTFNLSRFRAETTARGTYGVSLLPGLKITDTLLGYVRLGYNWVNFQSQLNVRFHGLPVFSRSRNNTSGGFNYGVGMEALVYENWSARTEFTHTNYNSNNEFGNPADNQFMLSAIYHIA